MDLPSARTSKFLVVGIVVLGVIGLAGAWYWPRTDALSAALQPVLGEKTGDRVQVAKAILENDKETRSNASVWSGVYWGFTFAAAIFSALAGAILKVESVFKQHMEVKKDIVALLAVISALLITLSTSGDFQRKWQANRVAASELERTGYDFLEYDGSEPRKYFSHIGKILHKRNLAIVGDVDDKQPEAEVEPGASGT